MFNGNPHPPSTSWLNTVASGEAYGEAEPGDDGRIVLERGGETFVVDVACVHEAERDRSDSTDDTDNTQATDEQV
jgi:hypothetical protein